MQTIFDIADREELLKLVGGLNLGDFIPFELEYAEKKVAEERAKTHSRDEHLAWLARLWARRGDTAKSLECVRAIEDFSDRRQLWDNLSAEYGIPSKPPAGMPERTIVDLATPEELEQLFGFDDMSPASRAEHLAAVLAAPHDADWHHENLAFLYGRRGDLERMYYHIARIDDMHTRWDTMHLLMHYNSALQDLMTGKKG